MGLDPRRSRHFPPLLRGLLVFLLLLVDDRDALRKRTEGIRRIEVVFNLDGNSFDLLSEVFPVQMQARRVGDGYADNDSQSEGD